MTENIGDMNTETTTTEPTPEAAKLGRPSDPARADWVKRQYRLDAEVYDLALQLVSETGLTLDTVARLALRRYADARAVTLRGGDAKIPAGEPSSSPTRGTRRRARLYLWIRMPPDWDDAIPRLFAREIRAPAQVLREAIRDFGAMSPSDRRAYLGLGNTTTAA